MRSTSAWVAILLAAGTGVFCWQRAEIVGLRGLIARQDSALQNNEARVDDLSLLVAGPSGGGRVTPALLTAQARATNGFRGSTDGSLAPRADERRVILDQYREVLAELNLPAATATRIENLLADRIETVLDAEDAARREGFAEGSSETARIVVLAVSDLDRQIASLVGLEGYRRLDGLPSASSPTPVVGPEPAAPPTVVNVMVEASPSYAAQPAYSDTTSPPALSDAYPYAPYAPYFYVPIGGVSFGRGALRTERPGRSFAIRRPAAEGPHRRI